MSSNGKTIINISNKYDRIVVLIDMDCFYCQVEEKLNSDLKGKPMAVVQYNTWQGGGIIAVNYAARAAGVTRHMRGNQAKEQCPEIKLIQVPSFREKADLTKYREAGKDVANVLQTFTSILERASVDEAYLDITKEVNERTLAIDKGTYCIKPEQLINTFAAGYHSLNYYISEMSCKYGNNLCQDYDLEDIEHDDNDINSIRTSSLRLLVGASIVNEIRAKVKEITGFECSAGIAHNKILAKFACGINKPNKQTLFPLKNVVHIFRTLQLSRIISLGGKFGAEVCEKLKIMYIGEVKKFSEKDLKKKFGDKNGSWLYLICRGIDLEAVTPRFCSKSIGCCKKFPGRAAIVGLNSLKYWLNELAIEICDRLEKDALENSRKGRQLVVNYVQEINSKEISSSRSTTLISYDPTEIANLALEVIKCNSTTFLRNDSEKLITYPIKFLGLSVGKFESNIAPKSTIKAMFEKQISERPLINHLNSNMNLRPFTETLSNCSEIKGDNVQISKKNELSNSTSYKLFEKKMVCAKSKDTVAIARSQDEKDKVKTVEDYICASDAYNVKEFELVVPEEAFEYDDLTSFINKNDSIPDKYQTSTQKKLFSPNYKMSIANSIYNLNQPGTASESKDSKSPKFFENEMAKTKSKDTIAIAFDQEENHKWKNLEESKENLESPIDLASNICDSNPSIAKEIELLVPQLEKEVEYDNSLTSKKDIVSDKTQNTVGKKVFLPNYKISGADLIEDSNQLGLSFSQNYLTNYAEFQVPKSVAEDCTFCSQCNQKVLVNDLQTHMDRHLAFQLTQQQREEHRRDVRKQFNSTPPNKKIRSNNETKSHNTKSQINISRYLVKFNEPKENQIICSECNCYVMKDKILDHKDFHMAQKIQRDWSFHNSNSSEPSSIKKH